MKKIIVLLAMLVLAGCAGLDVTYQFHANYKSEELIRKEQDAADRAQAALDRAQDAKRYDEIMRAMRP